MSKLDEIVDMLQNSGLDLALSDDFKKESDQIKAKANYAKHYKQQIKALMLELIGGDLGGRFYTTRKLKEVDGLTAINDFKAELRKKLEEL